MNGIANWFGLPLSFEAAASLLGFQMLFVTFGIPAWLYARFRYRNPDTLAILHATGTVIISWIVLIGYRFAMLPFFEAYMFKAWLETRYDGEQLVLLPDSGFGTMMIIMFGWVPACLSILVVAIARGIARLFRKSLVQFGTDRPAS